MSTSAASSPLRNPPPPPVHSPVTPLVGTLPSLIPARDRTPSLSSLASQSMPAGAPTQSPKPAHPGRTDTPTNDTRNYRSGSTTMSPQRSHNFSMPTSTVATPPPQTRRVHPDSLTPTPVRNRGMTAGSTARDPIAHISAADQARQYPPEHFDRRPSGGTDLNGPLGPALPAFPQQSSSSHVGPPNHPHVMAKHGGSGHSPAIPFVRSSVQSQPQSGNQAGGGQAGGSQGNGNQVVSFHIPTPPPGGGPSRMHPQQGRSHSQVQAQVQAQAVAHHTRKRSQTLPDHSATYNLYQSHARDGHQPNLAPHQLPLIVMGSGSNINNNNYNNNPTARTEKPSLSPLPHHPPAVTFPRSPQIQVPPTTTTMDKEKDRDKEKETKPTKDKPKIKLFSKPKNITIGKETAADKRNGPLPSPGNWTGTFPKLLGEGQVGPGSIYSSVHASTSALSISNLSIMNHGEDKEKEKHKHHFLSRQKAKYKDDFHLPLSSVSSTSRPADPSAPQPLYSFTTSTSTAGPFAKSVTGFDLRSGGKKRKEGKEKDKDKEKDRDKDGKDKDGKEKPVIGAIMFGNHYHHHDGNVSIRPGEGDISLAWPEHALGSVETGPRGDYSVSSAELSALASRFGVTNLTVADVWPLFKSRVLKRFDGEDVRTPVEDFNELLTVHIRVCIQRQAPAVLVSDLHDLARTGFGAMDRILAQTSDEMFVVRLVHVWITAFTVVLPFLEATLFPLDQEFRGTGAMSSPEAAEFWRPIRPDGGGGTDDPARPRTRSDSRSTINQQQQQQQQLQQKQQHQQTMNLVGNLGAAVDLAGNFSVRQMALLAFRDVVILPRHDILMSRFSRFSFESLRPGLGLADATAMSSSFSSSSSSTAVPGSIAEPTNVLRPLGGSSTNIIGHRSGSFACPSDSTTPFCPGVQHQVPFAPSASIDSTGGGASAYSRSRATSNTSAGSLNSTTLGGYGTRFPTVSSLSTPTPTPPPLGLIGGGTGPGAGAGGFQDSSREVTQSVARMLQCIGILAGLQSADSDQERIDQLARTLRVNWLGSGRTGRNRRGFVAAKSSRSTTMV